MNAATRTRVVRVLVDVTGIHKTFDYLVGDDQVIDVLGCPEALAIGTQVRVRLGGRRVSGWVTEVGVEAPPGVELQRVLGVRGHGPYKDIVDLARWAAHRYVGHAAPLLQIASPSAIVRSIPKSLDSDIPRHEFPREVTDSVSAAIATGNAVVRLPPALDRTPYVIGFLDASFDRCGLGSALVVCPTQRLVQRLVPRLARAGFRVVDVSDGDTPTRRAQAWARAASGGFVVVGTRRAAWAPAPDLRLAIVVDEHDEALQSTRMPTWHARDVLAERASRAGATFVALSASPSLDVLATSTLVSVPREVERAGWPPVALIDRTDEDPATASSVLSDRLRAALSPKGRVVVVLNRTGRVRLLACRKCSALTRCEVCGAGVHAPGDDDLVCGRCGTQRPRVCVECGSVALKNLRIGVSRAREELEALVGEPVAEINDTSQGDDQSTRVVIGTEAVLHRVNQAATVAFLDFDAELTAPRFRAAEQAMTLLVRAARIVGGSSSDGRVVVQTRLADHPVLVSAVRANPSILVEYERGVRSALRFPPFAALAQISGPGAPKFVEQLDTSIVEVLDGGSGSYLVRAASHGMLADALAPLERPSERVRIEVDPLRV